MGVLLSRSRMVSSASPRHSAMVPWPSMEHRKLGRTEIVASVLGFGGSEIGYQGVSPRTVARLLGSALDAGLNVIDTAECYDDSEALIGKAIGARRREVALFTKCGHAGGWSSADWRGAPPPGPSDARRPPPATRPLAPPHPPHPPPGR